MSSRTNLFIWKLFLDDERFPAENDPIWHIARNVGDAMEYIRMWGLPSYMSLDHDLGDGKLTGHDFCHELGRYCLEKDFDIPEFYVHSQNVVGRKNMLETLQDYKVIIITNKTHFGKEFDNNAR